MRYSFSFLYLVFLLLSGFYTLYGQEKPSIDRIDPPSWWVDMEFSEVQLMVYGKNLANVNISFDTKDILIKKIHEVENPNYLFVDISISSDAKAGKYSIRWENTKGKKKGTFPFELKLREKSNNRYIGFNSSDVIYLLMPDRFSNGSPENDNIKGMLEKADRLNPNGRHGGDIKGIINHLDYIKDMGFTCLWANPLLENNMPAYSYHGYAITDFYKTDPRFGSNLDYKRMVDSSHGKGLKVIMDMVFNHCGTGCYFIKDLPMRDWINQHAEFTRSNFRGEVNIDPYASEFDKAKMANGWFDNTMADLNQKNPFVYRYLLQNSIWWIEYAGIDGIRMDTYPYPDKIAMAVWTDTIMKLYPGFNIVGECWLREPSHTAYWQMDGANYDGFNSQLPSVTDFPTYYALKDALNEKDGWVEGLSRLYYTLSQDYLYPNPQNLLVFPDNHDLTRFYTDINQDFNNFKIGISYILTTRGIPQIYYGTEILMTGNESDGHGFIRQDLPGGWESDTASVFNGIGLNTQQKEAQDFMKQLLKWRKTSTAVHTGKFKHFIPENGIYVYFRYNEAETVMVVLNKNSKEVEVSTDRFSEVLSSYTMAKNIITNKIVTDLNKIIVPAESPLILGLMK